MLDNSNIRKPRVGFVKSRTGCTVCKVRRIKCDETKPSCRRCTASGRICEGYSINKVTAPANRTGNIIVPKQILPNPVASQPLEASFPRDDGDQLSSQVSWNNAAAQIRCCLGLPFWEQVISRLTVGEEAIKCLVLALGALDYTSVASSHSQVPLSKEGRNVLALAQYEQAIQILRYPPQKHLATSIAASILIMFFETTQGDVASAKTQFFAGIEVVKSVKNNTKEHRKCTTPGTLEHGLHNAHLQIYLQLLFINIYLKPGRVDDHNIASTQHLYSQFNIFTIPTSFTDLREARVRLECYLCQGLNFVMSLNKYRYTKPDITPADDWLHFLTTPREQFPYAIFNEQQEILTQLSLWREAFQPFLYSRTTAGENYCSMASALEAMYLAGHVIVATAFSDKQTDFDMFNPHFSSIVSLCRSIIHQRKWTDQAHDMDFSLDSSVVCPLFIVGLKCRDPIIRREAISLLRKMKSANLQGLWPLSLMEGIISWIMNVEEGGVEGEFIAEESRTWICEVIGDDGTRGGSFNTSVRWMKLQCQLFPQDLPRNSTTGASIIKETVLQY